MPQPGLSPSRAADFARCPLLFRIRAVDRLPEPRTIAQARGTVVHLVMERLFDLPPSHRTPDGAVALIVTAVDDAVAKDPSIGALLATPESHNTFTSEVSELVKSDFSLEDPSRLQPEARELWVEAPIGGEEPGASLNVRGYIDRLDVAPGSGALRIVDYKTGKAPKPAYRNEALFQLRCYALALWRLRGVVPAMLQLLYLASGQVLRAEPTQADLELTEARLLGVWAGIVRSARTDQWPAARGPLCPWCHFQSQCPAFGNPAPPTPQDILARLGVA
ncbi:MAG: PD-(D/E)XK nuclease family protein [Bifidobacteriaceae bacterium]|jgi:putative RecB family exonuclease|nr:PD-(D/E)XK nuclease family protein [Bifidobacteriaceae bacterium]